MKLHRIKPMQLLYLSFHKQPIAAPTSEQLYKTEAFIARSTMLCAVSHPIKKAVQISA